MACQCKLVIVVSRIIAKAEKEALPVKLRVLRPNPAKKFYERLGFAVYETTEELSLIHI